MECRYVLDVLSDTLRQFYLNYNLPLSTLIVDEGRFFVALRFVIKEASMKIVVFLEGEYLALIITIFVEYCKTLIEFS